MKFLRSSLYLKLFTIYSITFIAIIAALAIAVKKSRPVSIENSITNNIRSYAQYISDDIGTPPNIERAKEIQKTTQLDIAIFGNNFEWTNDPGLCEHFRKKLKNKNFINKKTRHGWIIQKNGYVFVYGTKNLKAPGLHWEIVISFILIFAIVLIISYRTVKKVMSPIIEMKNAADAFGEGKWDTKIIVRSHDELADLGNTMNDMARKIDSHFKNMKDLLLAISHELRSPLTRMRVTTEFIPDLKIRKSLNEEINHLDRITSMLLERERLSARPEILEKRAVNLTELTETVTKKFTDVTLHSQVNETVLVDVNRFELALSAIIDNAFKHGKPPVDISIGANHELIWLEIKDHGEGISKENIERIGEPFFRQNEARTSSRTSDGFGLGLSLAHSILKAHGFHLSARSENGTVFRVEMPRALFLTRPTH